MRVNAFVKHRDMNNIARFAVVAVLVMRNSSTPAVRSPGKPVARGGRLPTRDNVVESLESRVLLALSAVLDNGLLSVEGTRGADVITLDVQNGQVNVAINSATFTAPVADVNRVRINAGPGRDRVTLTDAVNIPATIFAGDGNDYLRGGNRACRLLGEGGNDTLVGGRGRDAFIGGLGTDAVDYSARTEDLQISLDGKANDGTAPAAGGKGESDNVSTDIEIVIGGAGNDLIVGSMRNDTLIGGQGNDTLIGGDGNDLLAGGAGTDLLQGGGGDDVLLGIDGAASDTLDGGDGVDAVAYDSISSVTDTLLGIELEVSVLAV
jgi:Ca2+-binding RTX toxin-like protein